MYKTIVGVIGSSQAGEEEAEIAKKVGREIAKREYVLLTGARGGVMKAACIGAKSEGGLTLGILPFSKKTKANRYTDIVIPTGMGSTRNSLNTLTADYIIVVGGGSGTLSEIAFAWMYNKPILAFSGVKGWSTKLAGKQLDDKRKDHIIPVETAKEALNCIYRHETSKER